MSGGTGVFASAHLYAGGGPAVDDFAAADGEVHAQQRGAILAERWPETTGAGQRGISLGAAAYCRARQKVPTLVARQVLEQMIVVFARF